ncbi:MAG TPA: M23 family metallopeptidase [Thermoanaerobaculia bacterium]|jgi:murein DD-endopeptidase MepM/ murein hydrolase activator NlpD|nr:M23 family metallopeptidase [Thermoanaerobaculia bacterium]
MPRQHHTVIFVPHAHAKLRKWRVTNLQIGLVTGALLLLTLTAAFFIWSHFSTKANPVEIARLAGENEKLREVNQEFESSIRKLQDQLTSYEDRTRQLAIVAGIATLGEAGQAGDTGEAGIGGGTPVDGPVDEIGVEDLPAMQGRIRQIDGTLKAVETRLHQRARWISQTPAITPVKGILTSGFGYRNDPVTHGHGDHQGVDIAAAPGQPVRASADGIVMRAGMIGGLGKAIYLAHGYGVTTRYGHMSKVEVRPGQRVKRGDIIGRVGNTGRSTGYHLHYEVRQDGQPVNPLVYILDNGGRPL